jgi:Transglutaminase-like superfamily
MRLVTDEYTVALRPSLCALLPFLAVVRVMLRTTGLMRTCKVLGLWRRRTPPHEPTIERLSAVVQDVAIASAFFPGRSRCLEQSVAVWALLRWSGIASDIRLGVRPDRFTAHAWVEHAGAPVGDSAEGVGQFVSMPAVTA